MISQKEGNSTLVDLKRLRRLRGRADKLMSRIVEDLRPFQQSDGVTFRRKPDSRFDSNDVNVTTSCSCLMALALTDRLESYYSKAGAKDKTDMARKNVSEALRKLVGAPWMSSGLTENNAFTTTLVIRLLGYLQQSELFSDAVLADAFKKPWAINLGLIDPLGLARKLFEEKREISSFLRQSLTDSTRTTIERWVRGGDDHKGEVTAAMAMELNRVIYGPLIYHKDRFPDSSLPADTLKLVTEQPTGYGVNRLNRLLLAAAYPAEIETPVDKTLGEIAAKLGESAEHFAINQYPPAPAVLYWFVDGVDRAEIMLSKGSLETLSKWAAEQFYHQRSLVAAQHEAVIDPIAMAMAACLCQRLAKMANNPRRGPAERPTVPLPSKIELENSIVQLFGKQTDTGIWPKYFPMFHYQEAGSNFCFTFEMLEAILMEFADTGSSLLRLGEFINGLEKAVTWCESNRLSHKRDNVTDYSGWNSGGDPKTLMKDQPESWATAVIYMFLWELNDVLNRKIQQLILQSYNARTGADYQGKWGKILDVDVELQAAGRSTVKSVIEREIIGSATLVPEDIVSIESLAKKLQSGKDAVSAYLVTRFSEAATAALSKYKAGNDGELQKIVTSELNAIIRAEAIYDRARFRDIKLSRQTKELLTAGPTKIAILNRSLIGDTYPVEISKRQLTEHARQYRPFSVRPMSGRRSVLLFGPPGTSKTSLVRAFAGELDWPILEIEPSHFLTNGIDKVYSRTDEIFQELAELSGVVVFFDEMDALVRTRAGQEGTMDIMSRFLTTSMLPKLAKLHDDGRVVFFFATNYQDQFDSAIKRPGRFDILLCVWPPDWGRKRQALSAILGSKTDPDHLPAITAKIDELTAKADAGQKQILDYMTFAEASTFFETLGRQGVNLKTALDETDAHRFLKTLSEFGATITLRPGGDHFTEYVNEKNSSRYQ